MTDNQENFPTLESKELDEETKGVLLDTFNRLFYGVYDEIIESATVEGLRTGSRTLLQITLPRYEAKGVPQETDKGATIKYEAAGLTTGVYRLMVRVYQSEDELIPEQFSLSRGYISLSKLEQEVNLVRVTVPNMESETTVTIYNDADPTEIIFGLLDSLECAKL